MVGIGYPRLPGCKGPNGLSTLPHSGAQRERVCRGSSALRRESERMLAAKATFRLRQLVSRGGLDLQLVPCACRRGTEGTPHCNYGRACGTLTAAGKDVGELLISEGLARNYVCGRTTCLHR